MAKTIVVNITSDLDAKGFSRLKKELDESSAKVSEASKKSSGSSSGFLSGLKKSFLAVAAAVAASGALVYKCLQNYFSFETLQYQFKGLMGSMDAARDHMAMLQELGDTPPFSMKEFASASRQMMVLSGGVLGMRDSLLMVGDAAAATGSSLDEISSVVAKAYEYIRDGEPIGRMGKQLVNLGLITPAVASSLENLQKSGASNSEVWQTLTDSLKRFQGSMEEFAGTGEGMVGMLKEEWGKVIRTIGELFSDVAKNSLGFLIEKLHQLNSDGTIKQWAIDVREYLAEVVSSFRDVSASISETQEKTSVWGKIWGGVKNFGAAAASGTIYAAARMSGQQPTEADQTANIWLMGHSTGGLQENASKIAGISLHEMAVLNLDQSAIDRHARAVERATIAQEESAKKEKETIKAQEAASTEAKKLSEDLAAAQAAKNEAFSRAALSMFGSAIKRDQTQNARDLSEMKISHMEEAIKKGGPGTEPAEMSARDYGKKMADLDKATDRQVKDDLRYAKHMENLRKKQASGTKLSKKEAAALANFDEQNNAAAQAAKAMRDLPKEKKTLSDLDKTLQKIDKDIQDALKAMGVD